jgi:hypothetical protein
MLRGDRLVFAMFPCVGRLSNRVSLRTEGNIYSKDSIKEGRIAGSHGKNGISQSV